MQPVHIFCYECRCVQKVVKIVCLSHDMLQSVIVSGAVIIYYITYPMLMVFYNTHALLHCIITSVIFLAVQNNYLQGQIIMLVSDFEIIITKPFPAALMLSPFGFYGDI